MQYKSCKFNAEGMEVVVLGIVDYSEVVAFRVEIDGSPVSWAMTENQLNQHKALLVKYGCG